MEKINKKICYWIEDANGERRLTFGCYYPDDINELDDEEMRRKVVEYLSQNINLSQYRKILICERTLFDYKKEEVMHVWQVDGAEKPKNLLYEGCYQQGNDKSLFCAVELISDKANEIVPGHDIIMLVPKTETVALEEVFQLFKQNCYSSFGGNKFNGLYKHLISLFPQSSLIVYEGMVDIRLYKKVPSFVGTVYATNIYGELCNCDISEKYIAE